MRATVSKPIYYYVRGRPSDIVRPNSQFYPAPAAPPWRWAFALGGLRTAPDEAYRRWGLSAQPRRARKLKERHR